MKQIVGSQSKVPIELLYLETSSISIEFILASLRLNYLHNVLPKNLNLVMKCVYFAQKVNPSNGDRCLLIEKDMELVNINMAKNKKRSMHKTHFKNHVKICCFICSFWVYKANKVEHEKVKHVEYKSFKLQPYLTSASFSQCSSICVQTQWMDSRCVFKTCTKTTLYAILAALNKIH